MVKTDVTMIVSSWSGMLGDGLLKVGGDLRIDEFPEKFCVFWGFDFPVDEHFEESVAGSDCQVKRSVVREITHDLVTLLPARMKDCHGESESFVGLVDAVRAALPVTSEYVLSWFHWFGFGDSLMM
jgi:hypothetical protein